MNYKRLSNYIREVDVRNEGDSITNLLGINIDKYYMPSVANVVGTDLSRYKIVEKGQFACNRMHVGRDKRLPVALSTKEDKFIVSPAYDVFEIMNREELLPEYLMMWFSRKEFDRNTWFYTDADVRGGLNWNTFLDMQLPIPSPEKQCEIVAEYNAVQNRINLNNQLTQKLEETAQAIYKQWFVDFEFPNEEGKPYKSSGGEMVESELGEIPKGWRVEKIDDVVEIIGGGTPSTEIEEYWDKGDILWYSPTDLTKNNTIFSCESEKKITISGLNNSSAKIFPAYSLLMTSRATIGKLTINTRESSTNQGFIVLIPNKEKGISVLLLFDWIKTKMRIIQTLSSGSTFLEISKSDFKGLDIVLPNSKHILEKYYQVIKPLFEYIHLKEKENITMSNTQSLLLSKMATIEN